MNLERRNLTWFLQKDELIPEEATVLCTRIYAAVRRIVNRFVSKRPIVFLERSRTSVGWQVVWELIQARKKMVDSGDVERFAEVCVKHAVNDVLKRLAAKGRRQGLLAARPDHLDVPAEELTPEEVAQMNECHEAYEFVRAALKREHPELYEVIRLKYYEGLGRRRIASELGITEYEAGKRLGEASAYFADHLPKGCREWLSEV